MRLKRLPGRPARLPEYQGRLEPYRVKFWTDPNAPPRTPWRACLVVMRGRSYVPGRNCFRTLAEAKAAIVKLWLQLRLDEVWTTLKGTVPPGPWLDFHALYRAAYYMRDDLAPSLLRDWLEDNGHGRLLSVMILAPGRRSHVRWPAGWDAVVQDE
jgi:hypothetical protein